MSEVKIDHEDLNDFLIKLINKTYCLLLSSNNNIEDINLQEEDEELRLTIICKNHSLTYEDSVIINVLNLNIDSTIDSIKEIECKWQQLKDTL